MKKIGTIIYGMIPAMAMALLIGFGCKDASHGSAEGPGGSSGEGGSMARFTIVGDYMYTVDHSSLKVVSLAIPEDPFQVIKHNIGFEIETIFPMDNYLFIGSRSAMFIYDISEPEAPERIATASHFTSCDPVVASGNYAYVTLNSASGWWCGNRNNSLLVYDITDIESPRLRQTFNLTSPMGLSVDGDEKLLFVCDGGLVVAYQINEPEEEEQPKYLKRLYSTSGVVEARGMDAYDCIARDGHLIITGADGIYQLGYDQEKFTFISKIDLRKP